MLLAAGMLIAGIVLRIRIRGKVAIPGIAVNVFFLLLQIGLVFWASEEFAEPGFMGGLAALPAMFFIMGIMAIHVLVFFILGIRLMVRAEQKEAMEKQNS